MTLIYTILIVLIIWNIVLSIAIYVNGNGKNRIVFEEDGVWLYKGYFANRVITWFWYKGD